MIKGKRILLLAPSFFDYEQEIMAQLSKLDYCVQFINTSPSRIEGIVYGVFTKLSTGNRYVAKRIENRIRRKIGENTYDIIIVISSWAVTSRLTTILRSKHLNKSGRMVLYYWDSLKRLKDDTSRWRDFDRIFTFDSLDSREHSDKMVFLPLFYCDRYWHNSVEEETDDVTVIGSFRLDRLAFVRNIIESNPGLTINSYLYESKAVFILHKLFRRKYRNINSSELKFEKLDINEVVRMYLNSRAVLDIPAYGQTGLTIRTIEALAMHKKLITSNIDIVNYDFYNPEDIFVIKEDLLKLPEKRWFARSFSINDAIIEKYSIREWVSTLLCNSPLGS